MLTEQDLQTLIEAMEAWENKDVSGELMSAMVGSILIGNDPIGREKFLAEQKQTMRKAEDARRIRRERSVVIRAKLLQMRDAQTADIVMTEGFAEREKRT